jgi:hypothetical protein
MTYKVEIDQNGRGGTIRYIEDEQTLSFGWEFSMDGADIFVPTPAQWDANTRWASGRRQEILERVAAEVRDQKAKSASVSIEDNWISLRF